MQQQQQQFANRPMGQLVFPLALSALLAARSFVHANYSIFFCLISARESNSEGTGLLYVQCTSLPYETQGWIRIIFFGANLFPTSLLPLGRRHGKSCQGRLKGNVK